MTPEEREHKDLLELALTTARILRARIDSPGPAYAGDDIAALDEALAPFGPSNVVPIQPNQTQGSRPSDD